MCDSSFNSDSTYCSQYENIEQSQKTKCQILNNYKILYKINKAISNHWEAKKLIGRVEAVKYLKLISKMNLKNVKDQCLAKHINSSLNKIYHLTKQFEESFNIGNVPSVVDPTENVSLSEDLKHVYAEDDPKQILLKSTSVNDESSSFPFEFLTNHNFISSSCVNLHDPINDHQNKEEVMDKFLENKHTQQSNVSNTLSLDSSEAYIQSLSPCSIEKISTVEDKKNKGEIYKPFENKNKSQLNISSENSEVYLQTQSPGVSKEGFPTKHIRENHELEMDPNYNYNSTTGNKSRHKNISLINSGESCTMLKISKICAYLSTSSDKGNAVQTCETVNCGKENLSVNIWNPDLKTLLDLGNLFNESHNMYFYTLCHETGNNFNKSWLETENNFTTGQFIAQHVNTTLEKSFEKLRLSESDSSQFQTETDVHKFDEEDKQKLNLAELVKSNQVRLEQICVSFQSYLCLKQMGTEYEDDFQIPDWQLD